MDDGVLGDLAAEWESEPLGTLTKDDWDIYSDGDYIIDESFEGDGFNSWPPSFAELSTSVLTTIRQAGLTGSKLALQAGMESELLTQALQEMKTTATFSARGYVLRDLVTEVQRAVDSDPLNKRARNLGFGPRMGRSWDVVVAGDLGIPTSTSSSSSTVLPPVLLPCKGTRGRKARVGTALAMQTSRHDRDAELLFQCQTRLVEYLMESETPSVIQSRSSSDPKKVLQDLIGKTSHSTASAYLRRWSLMREWVSRTCNTNWPTEQGPLLDYLHMLREQPCKPTVPQSWYQAILWMYKAGGFKGLDNPAEGQLVVRTVERMTVESSAFVKAVCQAVRYPIVVLASLELYVLCKQNPIFKRIQAGAMLVKSWGTLRFDDLQRIHRRTLRIVDNWAQTDLMSSKTSGPGKRVKQLPVAISIHAELLDVQWLTTFLELVAAHLPADTDYLLDQCTSDFRRSTGIMLTYAQSSAISGLVLQELTVPAMREGGWVSTDVLIFPPELVGLASEHSGRAVVPSAAIIVEDDKSKRDMAGRWRPTASDDYSRTHRVVVTNIQQKVVAAFKQATGAPKVPEGDIVERARRYLCERKGFAEERAVEVCEVWRIRLEGFTRHLADVTKHQEASEEISLADIVAPVLPPLVPLEVSLRKARTKVVRQEKFLISYSRDESVARLHLAAGGCYWAGIELNNSQTFCIVDASMYNKRCKFCFPKSLVEADSDRSSSESSCE